MATGAEDAGGEEGVNASGMLMTNATTLAAGKTVRRDGVAHISDQP